MDAEGSGIQLDPHIYLDAHRSTALRGGTVASGAAGDESPRLGGAHGLPDGARGWGCAPSRCCASARGRRSPTRRRRTSPSISSTPRWGDPPSTRCGSSDSSPTSAPSSRTPGEWPWDATTCTPRRFLTHLQFFAERLFLRPARGAGRRPAVRDHDGQAPARGRHGRAHRAFVLREHRVAISDEEVGYLASTSLALNRAEPRKVPHGTAHRRLRLSSGLHSRPAATLAKAATASKHAVTLAAGDTSVDARCILALLQLGVKTGDEVSLEVDGPEATVSPTNSRHCSSRISTHPDSDGARDRSGLPRLRSVPRAPLSAVWHERSAASSERPVRHPHGRRPAASQPRAGTLETMTDQPPCAPPRPGRRAPRGAGRHRRPRDEAETKDHRRPPGAPKTEGWQQAKDETGRPLLQFASPKRGKPPCTSPTSPTTSASRS